jgi:HD superfamily phosphohydrolase
MTISCQNELINHRKQIKDLAKVYNSKEDDYLQQVKNSNDSKNELISNNNKLTVENKELLDNYNSISTIKDNECNEKIQAEKIKCDTYKANINSLTGGFREVLNSFENKVSGGIVGQIKTNLKTKCENEKETYKNIIYDWCNYKNCINDIGYIYF